MMKKVLVTGAKGFIGRNLINFLISKNIEVIGLDLKECDSKLPNEVHFVPFDLSNYAGIAKLNGEIKNIDVVYHLAWVGVSGSLRGDIESQLSNIRASMNVLNLCPAWGCKRFVCLGSIMEKEAILATSTNGTKPSKGYIYGETKHYVHTATKSLAAELGVEHIWPVLTNTYGEGELSPRFINTTLRKIINGEYLEFTSGTQIYDFVHIDDTVRALYLIGEKGTPFHSYVVGSGEAGPLRSFVERIGKSFSLGDRLHFGEVPFSGVSLSYDDYDTKRTFIDTGFKAEIPFEIGIFRTMNWLKSINSQ